MAQSQSATQFISMQVESDLGCKLREPVLRVFTRWCLVLRSLFLCCVGARADTVLFLDDFGPSGAGPGTNWVALTTGYPDQTNDRILDGARSVLRMRCTNITPAQQRGIQTANSISISSVANNLHADLGFQARVGGNSSVTLELSGAAGSVRVFTQDWVPRQVTADGSGSAGKFAANSGSQAYTTSTYYHFTIDAFTNVTTIALKSDDQQTVLWRFTTDKLVLGDFGGSVGLKVFQVTGAGIVEAFINTIALSSCTNTSATAPGALVINSIPEPWRVHYVTNSSKPIMTMYTSGGETVAQYQDLVHTMANNPPKGLGNAFDPGPSFGSYNRPQWQWLADHGYPTLPYCVPFRTDAISTSDESLLKIMDNVGLFTSIQFGEWGYHFHTAKPYGPYDGFPKPMTNRIDCYDFLRSAYLQQTADYRRGWANSVTGHSHYESYAAEWGCRMVGIEVGENIAFTQSKFAFTRGASRQWEIPWSMQMSPWWNGYVTRWNTLAHGHSLSLWKRMLLHGWFAGAAWLTPENNANIIFNGGSPTNGMNAWGIELAKLYAFVNAHDRGTPYTPIAIVLDHHAGYNGYAHKAWGTLPFTAGDLEIDDLFVNQVFPGSDFIHCDPFPENREKGYLRETPYGEIFDVLLSSATAGTLNSYPAILLAGDITFDTQFKQVLQQVVQNGSMLMIHSRHRAALGNNFNILTNSGAVEVLPAWKNPVTARSTAIPSWRLQELSSAYLPIAVSGDPIQYSINRNAAGWVVELVHDSGVWKDPANAAVTNNSDVAVVSLQPSVPVVAARRWQIDGNGDIADADLMYTGMPLTVQVGPGECVYVEFTLLSTNLLLWLQYYYPTATDYAVLTDSDTDGDGMTAAKEYVAGTNPTNSASVLRIIGYDHGIGTSTLKWLGVTNRIYGVFASTNLLGGWTLQTDGLWGQPWGTNILVISNDARSGVMYKIRARMPTQ